MLPASQFRHLTCHIARLISRALQTPDFCGNNCKHNITQTRYVLDPAAGLTQVLSDGSATYLYGNGRIAQQQTNMQYFGADGLGSVRQMYNSSGQIIANHRFDPFGNTISQSGVGTSAYGFTGEWTDATGLEYLRARYYAPTQGRFVTKDVWEGDPNAPMSYNAWLYVYANPVNASDPSGLQGPTPICLPGSPYCIPTPCVPRIPFKECAPTPTPTPDFHVPTHGIPVDNKFDHAEYSLIRETLDRYVELLGTDAQFRRNVFLNGIAKSESLLPAGYDEFVTHKIFLAPNLLHAYQTAGSQIPPVNIFAADAFPMASRSIFPNQETVFKFVLAHEVTHALVTGNPDIYPSFVDRLYPKRQGCFPLNIFINWLDLRDPPENDPIIERNRQRIVRSQREEILADVVAAHLFAPGIMGNNRNKYEDWIKHDLPTLVK